MAREYQNSEPPGSLPPNDGDFTELRSGLKEAAHSFGTTRYANGATTDLTSIQQKLLPDSFLTFGSEHKIPDFNTHNVSLAGLDMMTNALRCNGSWKSQFDNNSNNIPGSILRLNQGFPRSKRNLDRFCESEMDCDTMTTDNMFDGASYLNNLQRPQIDQNFKTTETDSAKRIRITRQGGEKNSSIKRMQINKNYASCGPSTPTLYPTSDNRVQRIDDGMKDNLMQSGCQETTDGSLLTLGIEDIMEAVPIRFSNASFPQIDTTMGQTTYWSSKNPSHDMVGGLSSLQNNVAVFSGLAPNAGGWTGAYNINQGFMPGIDGLSSNPSEILQPHDVPMPENRTLVCEGSRDVISASVDAYKKAQNYSTAAARTVIASQGGQFDQGQIRLPGLTSDSANRKSITSQQYSNQPQKRLRNCSENILPETSAVLPFIGTQEGFTRQDQSCTLSQTQDSRPLQHCQYLPGHSFRTGQVIPGVRRKTVQASNVLMGPSYKTELQPSQAAAFSSSVPPKILSGPVIPAAKRETHNQALNALFRQSLNKSSVKTPPVHSTKFPNSVPFPNFLGPAFTTGPMIPITMGNEVGQASSAHVGSFLNSSAVQSPLAIPVVWHRKSMPQASTRLSIPTAAQTAPSIQVPAQTEPAPHTKSEGSMIPVAMGNEDSQASSAHVGSFLNSSAGQSPLAILVVQHRKSIPQASTQLSIPTAAQTAPSTQVPTQTEPAPHIKWEGVVELPEPIQEKCYLCKRDISYTPEGHIHLPTVPPSVAILPCRHAFHDHCLQLITPKHQSKEPPCIPCAVGEY